MKRFSLFVLLLTSLLFIPVFTLHAAADSIQITGATVICGTLNGDYGMMYGIDTTYSADGQRIIDQIMITSGGGGRLDAYHNVAAGTGTLTDSGSSYGGSWNGATWGPTGYPYTVELAMELYNATSVDYVNGGNVINGPMVARSAMLFLCTQDGPATVISEVGSESPPFNPGDGRINPDPAAPVAVYCRDYGIDVYSINDDSTGSLAFTATTDEIDAVGDLPPENTPIDAYGDIRLFRLTTGEFQINVGPDAEGKEFILIWDDC